MSSDSEQLYQHVEQCLQEGSLKKAVLSGPLQTSDSDPRRVDIRPVVIKKKHLFQFSYRLGNQEVHRNLNATEAAQEFRGLAGHRFRHGLVQTKDAEWTARFGSDGHCVLRKAQLPVTEVLPSGHDKTRQHLLADGQTIPFLIATGVMSKKGRVHAKQFSKFRQINRYVEFIRDVIPRLPTDGPIRVVDFGSGKSYLTFAVHYYLTQILGRRVEITGLDRREDVIHKCRSIAAQLSLAGIEFRVGDIADFSPESPVQLAISLHACDTATDDALAVAVSWKSDVILAAPCCHHELASKLTRDRVPVISQHGILHERFAAMATDAVRASLLETVGYQTSVMEFIEMEHTPRNLLIRALRRSTDGLPATDRNERQRLQTFSDEFGLPPLQLQRKLEEFGLVRPR